ncbi:ParA family protein [Cyanobacterium aponinum FACHB-4101]|uniref:ParA family protein n=1 Tax=Cyanobacterium aponinum TaxID=379064 RepID=UPI001680CF53|nr:ParA family protein [Cyanobacterium aponinum]MBD2395473.1 ParA family protein [Cyanobacterium aponinum FACHB-4101]
MVKIIAIANGKGGVGKTTTAVNITGILARKYSCLLVDTDPQGSATWWCQRGDFPFDIASETNADLLAKLRQISDYQAIIVDTPPALDSEALKTVIAVADYLVLPTIPAPMDLTALIATVQSIVLPVTNNYGVLITKVDPRCISEAKEAIQALKSAKIRVFEGIIRSYKVHERCPLEGVAITKAKGKNSRLGLRDYRQIVEELETNW